MLHYYNKVAVWKIVLGHTLNEMGLQLPGCMVNGLNPGVSVVCLA